MRPIQKISDLDTRPPEAGRIRLGVKVAIQGRDRNGNPKSRPDKLDTFRFTSAYRDQIERIAHLYGGQVKEWEEPKANPPKQWQVTTTTNIIPVYLPPVDALSTWYELWGGHGNERRCDGETVEVPVETRDGWEPRAEPCICAIEKVLKCRVTTRLTVILPAIDFKGTWRLDTKGWNATAELPGMVAMIQSLAEHGRAIAAELSISKRRQPHPVTGEMRNFIVPLLSIPYTPAAMLTGAATARPVLTTGSGQLAIDAPAQEVLQQPAEDEIIEAELVGDPRLIELEDRIFEICQLNRWDYNRLVQAIRVKVGISDRNTVDEQQLERIRTAVAGMESGKLVLQSFNPDGSIVWR